MNQGADVNEKAKIIERIRKLLSRTPDAGATIAEAETALSLARKLMDQHGLDAEIVEDLQPMTRSRLHDASPETQSTVARAFCAYAKCPNEIQDVAIRMAEIVVDPSADDQTRDMALATLDEAIFGDVVVDASCVNEQDEASVPIIPAEASGSISDGIVVFLLIAVVGLVCFIGAVAIPLLADPKFCGFPAVTICRICDHRVWAWQNYERRNFAVAFDNPDGIAAHVGMSGIVHRTCKGTPKVEIGIGRGTKGKRGSRKHE